MWRLFKLVLALAIMVSTGYALYRTGEGSRIVERSRYPDPQAFRKLAWAELDARQLKPGMPVFIRIFKLFPHYFIGLIIIFCKVFKFFCVFPFVYISSYFLFFSLLF